MAKLVNQKTLPKPKTIIDLGPFEDVQLALYTTKTDWSKAYCYYQKIPFAEQCENFLGCTSSLNDKHSKKAKAVYLVGVFDGRRQTLVHELAHAIIMLFTHYGIKHGDSNGEAFCYQFDNVFGACAPFFRKN